MGPSALFFVWGGMNPVTTTALGRWAESLGVTYLEGLGYEVLLRNYHCAEGEIDLIALEKGVLVFVEIRSRETDDHGHPLETISVGKQRRIAVTARHFLQEVGGPPGPCRFDALGILLQEPPVFTLVKEAFEA